MEPWERKGNFFSFQISILAVLKHDDYMNSTAKISYVENNFVSLVRVNRQKLLLHLRLGEGITNLGQQHKKCPRCLSANSITLTKNGL